MKAKIKNYLGIIFLAIITILLLFYKEVCSPTSMLEKCDIIFNQYNTSGILWVFWKIVSIVTRGIALVTVCINVLAIIGVIRGVVHAKRIFWTSLVLNMLNVSWLLILTIAEKSEMLLRFLAKICCFLSGVEYQAEADLSVAFKPLNYFLERRIVIGIVIVLLVGCLVWAVKEKNKEAINISYGKVAAYILLVGISQLFLTLCTESHTLYSILGIKKEQWVYFASLGDTKAGFGFFFYVPLIFLFLVSLVLLLHDKLSKGKMVLMSFGLFLAQTIFLIVGVLYSIALDTETARQNNLLYYSLSIKKEMIAECIGFSVFEFVAIVILLNLLSRRCSFLLALIVQICILICSLILMKFFQQINLFGVAIGLSSLIGYAILWSKRYLAQCNFFAGSIVL